MPFKPSMTAGIGSLLNTFLYRSPALKTVRSRLSGRALRVEVKGFSTSLILVFSERQVNVLGEWTGDADCTVIACASVLLKLRDHQQLAAPIRNSELGVQGDVQAVQNSTVPVGLTELDLAGLLTPYTDDIAAEDTSKILRGDTKLLHHDIKRQQCYVAKAITEEWRMAPGPLEVAWFTEGTAAVERAVGALTKRLEKLKAK